MPGLALKIVMALVTNAGALIQLGIGILEYATGKQKQNDCAEKKKDGKPN